LNIVVTGGAGFIGANLCHELARRPFVTKVVALDDLSTGSASNLSGTSAELVKASILDPDVLEQVVADADAVVHLAARPSVPRSLADPMESHEVNATGTLRVLEACRRHGVYLAAASSSSVYGAVAESPKHENLPTRPLSPYGASKLATEAYLLAYGSSFELPTLALRFFNVYGPLQPAGHAYAAVIPSFMHAALRGEPLRVFGDGLQTRDFTYVGTVTRVLADAVQRRITSSSPMNLAFGTRITLLELAHRLASALDVPVEIRHEAARPGDVRDSQAADGLLRAAFTDIAPVPLDQGLIETARWFRSQPEYAAQHPNSLVGTAKAT
jgi:UDP-glucose 4-epimerase